MKRLTALSIAVLLVTSLASVGCNDQLKKDYAELQQQYGSLQMVHQQTQRDLASAEAKNGELLSQIQSKDVQLVKAKDDLAKARMANPPVVGPTPPAGWQETATGAKLTLASDLLFSSGRATLSRGGASKIRQAASAIKSTYPKSIIRVYGFTDSDPIKKSARLWKDNLDLSANRAMAVSRELQKLGVPADGIETIAMGATHFIASNSTAAGKAKNRRVEIVVVTP